MSIASALFASAAPVSTGTSAAASGARSDADLFSNKIAAPTAKDKSPLPVQLTGKRLVADATPRADDPASIETPGKRDGFGILKSLIASGAEDQSKPAQPDDTADKPEENAASTSAVSVVVRQTPLAAAPSDQQASTANAGAVITDEPSQPTSGEKAADAVVHPAGAVSVAEEQTVLTANSATTSTFAATADPSIAGAQTLDMGQPSKADDAIKTAIAKVMADAQLPSAQVQIAVATTAAKPAALTPDVTAAVTAALIGDVETDAKPDDATGLIKTGAPTPLHAGRHDAGQRVEPILADASATPTSTGVETKTLAEANATASVSPSAADAKAAPEDTAAASSAAPESADSAIPTAPGSDAARSQSAVTADHGPALSTLSRATVETTAHLAAQIARKLDGRSTRFDMVLTPEDLGRVDVSLEIGKDGQLSARLAFDNPAAAADLRGRADELRRQLEAAGFQMTEDSLDFSQRDPSAGGGAFERQQQRNALFAGGGRLAAQADTPVLPAPGAWTHHSLTPDRVDLKV